MANRFDYFDLVASESGTGPSVIVHLYPNNSSVDSNWVDNGPVTDAVIDGLDQLVSWGALDWYEVWQLKDSEPHPQKDDSSRSSFRNGFADYFSNNSSSGEPCHFSGLHYGIGGDFDGGGGMSTDEISELAYWNNCWMFIGAGSGNVDRVKTFTKQEMVHSLIAYDDLKDTKYMDSGGHMHEHDPGKVISNSRISPLAITYHTSHAGHAECSNANFSISGYDPDYTSCTKTCVKKTTDKVFN